MKPLAHERASSAESTRSTRSERVDAVVICKDDGLLIELGPILGERYRTHSVDSPAEITANVTTARWIGIVDTDSLPDARGAVTRMEQQFHGCPLILISSHPQEWSAAISRGVAVVAVQRQEATGPRLLDALAAAEARLLGDVGFESTTPHANFEFGGSPGGASKLRWLLAAGLCVVLAAGGWWFAHRASPSRSSGIGAESAGGEAASEASGAAAASASGNATAAATGEPGAAQAAVATNAAGGTPSPQSSAGPAAAALPAAKPQSVLELLSAARVAFRDQRLLLPRPDGEPRGDSALELYTQVLSQDPGNDEALDGVRRLFLLGKTRVQADLTSGKLEDATRLVGLFRDAGVGATQLADLSASIAAARPKWALQRVQEALTAGDVKSAEQLIGQLTAQGADPSAIVQLRHALDARKLDTQLTAMAVQVHSAIAAGNLLQPADDNAHARIAAMRTLARTNPITLAAERDLTAALIGRGQQAMRDAQFDVAQRLFAAAGEFGSSSALSEARRELQSAMTAAQKRRAEAAAAAQAAAARPISSPSPAPSAAPRPAPPSYIAAHPARPLNVTYPPNANVAGYVIVEFTLSPDGTASDMSVVQSSPRGVFDKTAMEAVGAGRYSTRGLNGQPVRARIMLRFSPN